MLKYRTHSFTRAVVAGGLLSLAVATADTQAASLRAGQQQTAQAETQATPDAEIVAKIRKAITDDTALAAYAETLKIISSDGLVSLKGNVKSDADKKALGQKADAIVGEKNVMNNLVVTGDAGQPAPNTR